MSPLLWILDKTDSMSPMRSRHVSQVIAAPPTAVYDYAANPDNLPKWAAGLAQGEVVREGERLVMDSPMGKVTVTFAPRNDHGIIDHDVRLPTGDVVHNPVRVIAHPDGAEIIFTVRQLSLTDEEFDQDTEAVAQDLDTLKALIEQTS